MRSIFWKIFAVIWLSSAVIAVGSWVLLFNETLQKAKEIEWQESFKVQLAGITAQYERWGQFISGDVMPAYTFGVINFVVIDEQSGTLVHGDPALLDFAESRNITYTSERGRQYRVYIPPPDYSVLGAIVSSSAKYRFWYALAVSAVFSLLLSFVVIRPIKRLQTHIDIMGTGELDTRLDRKLTKRRDEFGSLARSFNFMARRIQSLVSSKQQLLHDVSHELRAPLSRLQVAGELARCEAEAVGISGEMYNRLDRECGALKKLIDEILTLSRMEVDSLRKVDDLERCDLNALAKRMIEDARFLHSQREITYVVEGKARRLKTSAVVLERALKNILENAIKYSPDSTPVAVILKFERRKTILAVADQGPGMSKEDIRNVFTPFYRVKRYDSKEGYGLGMSIVNKSVQRLGGEIAVANVPKGGLRVSIILPG